LASGAPSQCYNHAMHGEVPETKRCRRCGERKPLAFFPRDRSRPDGRWHSCFACNRAYWTARGKVQRLRRSLRRQYEHQSLQGIRGLRLHRRLRVGRGRLLLPQLQLIRLQLLEGYLAKHAWHMTPPLYASLHATATANAPRVGDRTLGYRLRALKGWRRRERKKREQEAQLAEWRARNEGKPHSWSVLGDV
jgi:hypothetical protein